MSGFVTGTQSTGAVAALTRTTRYTLMLTGLAAVASHLMTGSGAMLLGVALGGATQAANLHALAWLGRRLVQAGRRDAGPIAVLFGLKIAALIGAVLVMLTWLPLDPVGFMVGLATLMPAALSATLFSPAAPQQTQNAPETQV